MPLPTPVVCLVTDRRRLPAVGPDGLVMLAGAAARAGVNLIQIRERDLEARPLTDLTRRVLAATGSQGTQVVVNDRLDVAIAAGAHGVHLRADSLDVARVRAVAPAGFLVGRSVHALAEAVEAEAAGADYLVMGTIYPTSGKPDVTTAGPDALADVCRAVRVPVLAIGGVTVGRLEEVAAAGAAGIAAIGLFTAASSDDATGQLTAVVGAVHEAFAKDSRNGDARPARRPGD
jgi:thiamine-phosphate diphosphorylase